MLQFVLPTKRGPCFAVKSNFAIYHLVNVAVDFAPGGTAIPSPAAGDSQSKSAAEPLGWMGKRERIRGNLIFNESIWIWQGQEARKRPVTPTMSFTLSFVVVMPVDKLAQHPQHPQNPSGQRTRSIHESSSTIGTSNFDNEIRKLLIIFIIRNNKRPRWEGRVVRNRTLRA